MDPRTGRFRGFFCFNRARRRRSLMEDVMEITVNGEKKTVAPLSILGLLEELGIDSRRVAVELNMEILPKADYGTTNLSDGDRIEIVHFVGGG